jgi:hypothetical protein
MFVIMRRARPLGADRGNAVMTSASIHDRASVERLYPRDAFEADAGSNALGKTTVLHGVRILSAPDASGEFRLTRGSQHAGEVHVGGAQGRGNGLFLAPDLAANVATLAQDNADYAGAQEKGDAIRSVDARAAAYEAFIDRVIATAQAADFEEPIGRGEERLKGFHGG